MTATGKGLTEALNGCAAGDVLVVWKLDRLARSLHDLVVIAADLKGRNVGLKILTGEGAAVDTTHAQGRMHPDYFKLTGGLERWLYRLARKAVPDKAEVPAIPFRMETLYERSGVIEPKRNFARRIRKMAETQPLPEYGLRIDREGKHELVTLYRDRSKPPRVPRGLKQRV